MTDKKLKFICDLCGKDFNHSSGVYEGHRLELYGNSFCCSFCWEGNSDGWNTMREASLIEICEGKNIPIPSRNKKGLLPRN